MTDDSHPSPTIDAVPNLHARRLLHGTAVERRTELAEVRRAAMEIGFMTVSDTEIDEATVRRTLDAYRRFFALPTLTKRQVDMSCTGSNRGWGAPSAEQVDLDANPDYKEVFDVGPELPVGDPPTRLAYYAPNQWPDTPADFRETIADYYRQSCRLAMRLLSAVVEAIGEAPDHFDGAFDRPMALLRGNWYPPRPDDAGEADFGIAPHTDYGCLTLLATDGTAGLDILLRDGRWLPVTVAPGSFAVNFGEMLEFWSGRRIVATPHRVIGGSRERQSIPLFFNPRYDVDVSPPGSDQRTLAGDHLAKRYDETYVHRRSVERGG